MQIFKEKTIIYNDDGKELGEIYWFSPNKFSILFNECDKVEREQVLKFAEKIDEENTKIYLDHQRWRFMG